GYSKGQLLPDGVYNLQVFALDVKDTAVSLNSVKVLAKIRGMLPANAKTGEGIRYKVMEYKIPMDEVIQEEAVNNNLERQQTMLMGATSHQAETTSEMLRVLTRLAYNDMLGKSTYVPAQNTIDLHGGRAEIRYGIKEDIQIAS